MMMKVMNWQQVVSAKEKLADESDQRQPKSAENLQLQQFSTLVFAQREKVRSNLTRFVLIVWVFVVLVLTSMLTVDHLQPKTNHLNDLIKNGEFVGYQMGSFVREFLTNNDILESASLKSYSTVDQFHEAFSKDSRNGGVGPTIDELPYIRLLLSKHCDKYTMIGPIYPTSGFGFAFPKGLPLVFDVSHEILRLKEDKDLRLNLDSFKGLFVIAEMSSTLALAIFLSCFLIFTWEKDESLSPKKMRIPDRGVGVVSAAASPAMSIPCEQDQEGMVSQDEGFSTVEISVIQSPQETNP
ncbi:glutamate receptor 2.7-like [Salvia divinorum]|uniref:Glutamate receptor 2.7-like n=1 Tax=Salvia divinorum TaxID=28513 RepID=A0ABD1GWK0_SALDI